MNDYQKSRFVRRIVRTLFNTVSDKKIAIWGFAFKKDTNDTRESAAIYVCRDLLREHANLSIYDPKVSEEQIKYDLTQAMLGYDGRLTDDDAKLIENDVAIVHSAEEAAKDAHAVAILTEWDEFRSVNFDNVYQAMNKPAFIFDGRSLLKDHKLEETGFIYRGIGF
jgi:UDPglucose 6-dehydrogenase